MRSDEEAELFSKTFSKKVLVYPFINKPVLPRKRKKLNDGFFDNYFQVEGFSNNANAYHPTTPEEYFRLQCFENFDLIISYSKKYYTVKYSLNWTVFIVDMS